MIVKEDGKWKLKFSDGREEEFNTEDGAKDREQQVNYFKHLKKKVQDSKND